MAKFHEKRAITPEGILPELGKHILVLNIVNKFECHGGGIKRTFVLML